MTRLELFNKVTTGPWETVGLDVQYKIERNILCFQGSTTKEDWRNNFRFPAQPYRDCGWRVHHGFMDMWLSAEAEVLPKLLAIADPIILGYSQGAALATLAHEAYWWAKRKQPNTVIFGSPAPIWQPNTVIFGSPAPIWHPPAEVRGRWSNMVSVRTHGDPVTWLPPGFFGFESVGQVEYVGDWHIIWPSQHTEEVYKEALRG